MLLGGRECKDGRGSTTFGLFVWWRGVGRRLEIGDLFVRRNLEIWFSITETTDGLLTLSEISANECEEIFFAVNTFLLRTDSLARKTARIKTTGQLGQYVNFNYLKLHIGIIYMMLGYEATACCY